MCDSELLETELKGLQGPEQDGSYVRLNGPKNEMSCWRVNCMAHPLKHAGLSFSPSPNIMACIRPGLKTVISHLIAAQIRPMTQYQNYANWTTKYVAMHYKIKHGPEARGLVFCVSACSRGISQHYQVENLYNKHQHSSGIGSQTTLPKGSLIEDLFTQTIDELLIRIFARPFPCLVVLFPLQAFTLFQSC